MAEERERLNHDAERQARAERALAQRCRELAARAGPAAEAQRSLLDACGPLLLAADAAAIGTALIVLEPRTGEIAFLQRAVAGASVQRHVTVLGCEALNEMLDTLARSGERSGAEDCE